MKNAALKHDTQGFLLGEPTELSADGAKDLGAILSEVRTIRQYLAGASSSRSPSGKAPGRVAENDAILTPTKRSAATREVAQPMARGESVATTARAAADQKAVAAVVRRAVAPAVPKTRDDRGRFVPNGAGNGDKGDSPASDDRASRSLIGRLSRAVLNSGAGMEDADPAVKAFNEVAQPVARGYELLTGGSEDKKQTGTLRRILGALNVFRKDETAFNKAANKSLKTLEGKEGEGSSGSGGGFFGALMGLIPGMGLFSAALAKGGSLLSSFGSMLTKIPGVGAGKGLLSKLPGFGGLAGGAGIGGGAAAGGLAGGAKALGKGMLKRIPVLGALLGGALAWGESSAAENDKTLSPDQKRAKKGSAWGSAAGGVVGAAVGSLLGPVGMIVGGVVGDWLGGQFGEMIGGNWTAMTEGISSTWTACTSLFSSTWDGAVSGASAAFDSVKTTWGEAVGKVSSLFSSAYDYLKGIPVIGPAIEAAGNAAKKAAEVAASAASGVKGKAVDVAVAAKDKAVAAGAAVKESADRAYNVTAATAGSALETVMPKGYRHKALFDGIKGGDSLTKYGSYTDEEAAKIRELKTSGANTSANVSGGMSLEVQDKISAQAKKSGLDPVMMQKIAAMESGGNANAVSSTGAAGIYQFTGQTASGVGIKNRFDVDQNIEGGMKPGPPHSPCIIAVGMAPWK